MQEIQKSITDKIRIYSDELKTFQDKYQIPNSWVLLLNTEIPEEDRDHIRNILVRRDELIAVSNDIMHNYHVGMVDGCGFTGGVGMDDEKDKFRRVLYKCADLILDKGKDERYEKLTYTRFDGMSTTQILDTAMGCIAANELELALLGISYVLYQDKCELTNKHEIERINKLTARSEVGTIQSLETSENEETINGLTEPSPPPEAA